MKTYGKEGILKLLEVYSMNPQDEKFLKLLTRAQVAEKLGFTVRYIDVLRANDGLPWFLVGNKVRFRLEDVLAWLESKRRQGGVPSLMR